MARCIGCGNTKHEYEDCPKHPCQGCNCQSLRSDTCLRGVARVGTEKLERMLGKG